MRETNDKLVGTLIGVDSHAMSIINHFTQAAKAQGWVEEDINEVVEDAMSSTYEYLIQTITNQFIMREEVV
jgi:hypothetical protein